MTVTKAHSGPWIEVTHQSPHNRTRWAKIVAHIRDNRTGEVRRWDTDGPIDEDDRMSDFIWTDGNYACDCNRALFFGYAAGESCDDIDSDCGDGGYSVNLENPKTGAIFYREFP